MKVQLDNVWATPSTLHGRVTVWADDNRWRHRYDVHVPVESIPREAIEALLGDPDRDWKPDSTSEDVPLF